MFERHIDFIALKHDLKPLMTINCYTLKEFNDIFRFCRKNGLFAFRSKAGFKYINSAYKKYFRVYISKNKELAEKFSKEDPQYIKFPSEADGLPHFKYFSKMLGYPSCCIDAYLKLDTKCISEDRKKEILFRKFRSHKKNFLLNNFLYSLGYSLSWYQPCSYSCKAAINYNRKILEVVKQENPSFAAEIEEHLRLPLLVWFDDKGDMNDFFHNRIQILFKGRLINSTIYYKGIIYTKYRKYSPSFKNENQLKVFFSGNKCQVRNNRIIIFDGNKILKEIKTENKYHGVLIKFD